MRESRGWCYSLPDPPVGGMACLARYWISSTQPSTQHIPEVVSTCWMKEWVDGRTGGGNSETYKWQRAPTSIKLSYIFSHLERRLNVWWVNKGLKKNPWAKTKLLRMLVLLMETCKPSLMGSKNEIPYLSCDICQSLLFPWIWCGSSFTHSLGFGEID